MMNYARSDTHFLLYIYDRMRNALIASSNANLNLLYATLSKSEQTCLIRYEKPIIDYETGLGPYGWKNILSKYTSELTMEQFEVFKAVFQWRDHIAREEDENIRYVLPNHMLFKIAERLPTDTAGILACCNPTPPMVRMYAMDIAVVVEKTRMNVQQKLIALQEQAKEMELKNLEWQKAKERGAVHIIFDEGGEKIEVREGGVVVVSSSSSASSNNAISTSSITTTSKGESIDMSTILKPKPLPPIEQRQRNTDIKITTKNLPIGTMFGSMEPNLVETSSSHHDATLIENVKLAEKIHKTLVLETPSLLDTTEVEIEEWNESGGKLTQQELEQQIKNLKSDMLTGGVMLDSNETVIIESNEKESDIKQKINSDVVTISKEEKKDNDGDNDDQEMHESESKATSEIASESTQSAISTPSLGKNKRELSEDKESKEGEESKTSISDAITPSTTTTPTPTTIKESNKKKKSKSKKSKSKKKSNDQGPTSMSISTEDSKSTTEEIQKPFTPFDYSAQSDELFTETTNKANQKKAKFDPYGEPQTDFPSVSEKCYYNFIIA